MRTRAWLVLPLLTVGVVLSGVAPHCAAISGPGKLAGTAARAAYLHISLAIQRLQQAAQLADRQREAAIASIVAARQSLEAAAPLFASTDGSVQKRLTQVRTDLSHAEALSEPAHRDLLTRAVGDLYAVIDSQRPASFGVLAEERLTLTPNSIDFGTLCINEAVRLTATLKNETAVARNISFGSALPPQLSVVSGVPTTLAPGASTEVTFEFLAPAPIRLNRSVRLQGSAAGARNADIFVNFRATAAAYLFSPNPVDFGEVGIGDSVLQNFAIRNCSTVDAPMTVVLDDFDEMFTLDGGTQVPVTVPANGSMSFTVTFTPKRVGKQSDIVKVKGRIENRMREIGTVRLEGVGVEAVKVGARTLDFGTLPSGQLALRYCFFYNNTNLTQTVEIDGSHLPKTGPWGAIGTGKRTLSPKDTGSVLVSFQSTRRGAHTNKLIFTGPGIPRGKATLTLKARVR